MQPFSRQMGEGILGFCYFASDNDMEPEIRQRVRTFADAPYTDAQLYDMLASIAACACDRIGKPGTPGYFCVGHISGFVQAACDVKLHYERPAEGGAARSIPVEVLAHWKRDDP